MDYQEPDIWDRTRGLREYVSFIVEVADNGRHLIRSSDLDALSEADRKQYAYRPVFFKSEVLAKYYQSPELYSAEDVVIKKKAAGGLRSTTIKPGMSRFI